MCMASKRLLCVRGIRRRPVHQELEERMAALCSPTAALRDLAEPLKDPAPTQEQVQALRNDNMALAAALAELPGIERP